MFLRKFLAVGAQYGHQHWIQIWDPMSQTLGWCSKSSHVRVERLHCHWLPTVKSKQNDVTTMPPPNVLCPANLLGPGYFHSIRFTMPHTDYFCPRNQLLWLSDRHEAAFYLDQLTGNKKRVSIQLSIAAICRISIWYEQFILRCQFGISNLLRKH